MAFVWFVRRHDQVGRARNAAGRGVAFYERGLARLEDRRAGTGERGDRFCDGHHVYSNDLDLFGHGSLFELISLARTRTGEETLARWLTSPADADEIRARHEAVDELGPALDFRERLALAGTDIRAGVQTDRLLDWAAQSIPQQRGFQGLTWFLSAAVFVVVPYVAITSTWWLLGVVVALQAVLFGLMREPVMAEPPVPLLFLLDELFHGTNSHDRLVGAAGVLRHFLDRGAIGLVTTHDLALTAAADELSPRAANAQFQDWFEGNTITFDYRMAPGPVTRSNAIALMRAVGLEVDAGSAT